MQIRAGYELIYDCPQPTPMILMLSIHYTRVSDIVIPDHLTADPPVPMTSYRDGFGNWCTAHRCAQRPAPADRRCAAAGQRRARCSGALGAAARRRATARGMPGLSPGQPLLRDDRLSAMRRLGRFRPDEQHHRQPQSHPRRRRLGSGASPAALGQLHRIERGRARHGRCGQRHGRDRLAVISRCGAGAAPMPGAVSPAIGSMSSFRS